MTYDVVIRGGTIVDGAGSKPFRGDIAVQEGRIAEIGSVQRPGVEEIAAEGLTVTPGFIDLHTHFDAQVGWDPNLAPISWHGVTTALMGNCGVTFAPCKPQDREFLAGMMESVEDIPREAILNGLPWNWRHYGEYLDTVESLRPAINVAGLIGHSAVRYDVMGERSFAEQATEAECRQMCEIVAAALDAGAVGFSINRFDGHKAPDGRPIPGTFADAAELVEIGKTVAARNGVVQLVGATAGLLRRLTDDAGARVLFSSGVGAQPGAGQQLVDGLAQLAGERDMTALMQVKGTGYMFGLQCTLPFRGAAWDELRALDLPARLAAIQQPAMAARLIEEGKAQRPMLPAHEVEVELDHTYYIGDAEQPDLSAPPSASLQNLLAETGESAVELFLRLSIATQGRALFNYRLFCKSLEELEVVFRGSPALPGLGDAGAHVSQVIDADWATFVLKYWIRERQAFSLAEGIRRMTSAPARILGLTDRGRLQVGLRADINVIDIERVTQLQPRIVHDFPGGAAHFTQRARGYKATLVNGRINLLDDELTGARAGQVLRPLRAVAPAERSASAVA